MQPARAIGARVALMLLASCARTPAPYLSYVKVTAGPISDATVNIFALNPNGSMGAKIAGPLTTDLNGYAFLIPAVPPPTSPFIIVATGGTIADEATGSSVTLGPNDVLQAIPPVGAGLVPTSPLIAGSVSYAVTPLTNAAAARVLAVASGPQAISTVTGLENTIRAAASGIAGQFGLADINAVMPDDPTVPAVLPPNDVGPVAQLTGRQYGIVLAGLSQLAHDLNVAPQNLYRALAQDAADGTIDGEDPGTPITLITRSGGTVTLGPNTFTQQYQVSINNFAGGKGNAAGFRPVTISFQSLPIANGVLWITSTIPACISGTAVNLQLTVVGGTPPYRWTAANLPAGFAITATGVLQGVCPATLAESASPPFTITVTDAAAPPNTTTVNVPGLVSVTPPPQLILAGPAPVVVVGVPASVPLVTVNPASPGAGPLYSYFFGSLAYGTQPWGMGIDITNGNIVGTPTRAGNYTFQVCMTDGILAESCIPDPGQGVTVTVNPAPGSDAGSGGNAFDGNYTGTGTPTGCSNGQPPTNGIDLAFTIHDGSISGTAPVTMSGSVQSNGSASFSGPDGLGGTITFTGTFSSNGTGSGTGADAAPNVTCQFTWTATRS